MRATSYRPSSYRARPSLRSRATATSLSLAILAAIILALLWVSAAKLTEPKEGNALATFDVAAGQKQAAANRAAAPQPKTRTTPPRPDAQQPTPTPPIVVPPFPDMIRLSRRDFAASDIGKMPKSAAGAGNDTDVAATGSGASSAGIPGAAPGGETLYPAEWYREPTRAEMATYMPRTGGTGWGMIVCRTIARYHVEDCRELGESPGSGLARAMRQASFQFLVRPPTVNGKPQTGTWVRIRFDVIVKQGEAPPPEGVRRPRAGVGATGPVLN
ncbi:hypothetical protein M9980_03165 [Sphingomonas donggukensis]|uniref:Protein TonB n=1 Tax=Sphingomonas donggukensis TaxID=2949093 RepID=A0ABY4TWK3_9SPHN|nr:hypothetical protein [Sphingomonas donggukensis]URW76240.1 hypothetical protein M9980_03165 [Sphingomonas donggukensis]